MAFTPPPGSNFPGQSQFSLTDTGTYTTQPPYAYLLPVSAPEAEGQVRAVQDNFRYRPISYSPTSTSTTTQTTSTMTTTSTTATARISLPPLQRSQVPLLENDPAKPLIVSAIHPPRQQVEKLPSFKSHFETLIETPNRAGLPLPALDPLKEHVLSPEMMLELHYYDQLLAPSSHDLKLHRRQEIENGMGRLQSSQLNSKLLVEDYLSLLGLKIVYSFLEIEGGYIDFNKKIRGDHLTKALGHLVVAGKVLSSMKQRAKTYQYSGSLYSAHAEFLGFAQIVSVSHDIYVRESLIFFLQSVCCLKINKIAMTKNDACGVHEAYLLYHKSRMLINPYSTVFESTVQIAMTQMNSNLARLGYELALHNHSGTCYEQTKKMKASSTNSSSTSL